MKIKFDAESNLNKILRNIGEESKPFAKLPKKILFIRYFIIKVEMDTIWKVSEVLRKLFGWSAITALLFYATFSSRT